MLDESAGLLVPIYTNDRRWPPEDMPIRLGQGAAGYAIQHRQSVIVEDYPNWEHAVAWAIQRGLVAVKAAPLLVGDRAIGALVLRFYRSRLSTPEEERILSLLAAQVAPALEAARLYATSRAERERERALREIAQALAANLDEREVLDLAVHHGARLLGAPYARVWLFEPDGHLTCAAAEGFVHPGTFGRHLAPNSTSGQAAREQVLNLEDAPATQGWLVHRAFGEETGLGAYLGAGLWRAKESLGVIEVMREVGRRFQPWDEQLLVSLASAVAVAVSNARVHGQLQQRDIVLEAVGSAAGQLLSAPDWEQGIDSVLEQLAAATGVSRVYIAEVESPTPAARHQWTAPGVPARDDLHPSVRTPLRTAGLGRWRNLLRAGQAVHGTMSSLPEDERRALERQRIRSSLALPIFSGQDWWGFIGFDDCQAEREWSQGVIDVLRTAASTLGAAIERRRREQERLDLAREQSARAEAEAAQRRLAFLAEASQILASSLDYTTTLQSVARLAVPTLADHCMVDLLERGGSIRRMATANVDPAAEQALRSSRPQHSIDPNGPHPAAVALRTGRPLLYRELTASIIESFARSPGHHLAILKQNFKSGLIVPLLARSGPIGVISLLSSVGRKPYDAADLSLAEDLARRCALAIENASLYGEAREAINVRDEFLSVAAHELKTPLTSLRGYAQLLEREFHRDDMPKPDRIRRAATTIQTQTDKLSRLISQLLDISRIQSGKLAIERRPTDLSQLVLDAVAAAHAQLTRHTVDAHVPPEMRAEVDPLRVEQVFTNLLDNAIKYSPEGGQIDVQLIEEDGTARLAVRDRGIGVPVEHRPHIFDRFYQAHVGGPLTSMAGMGLGLYISRQIVELHGGTIRAEFPEDGGTTFVVTLPLGGREVDSSRVEGREPKTRS